MLTNFVADEYAPLLPRQASHASLRRRKTRISACDARHDSTGLLLPLVRCPVVALLIARASILPLETFLDLETLNSAWTSSWLCHHRLRQSQRL